MDDNSSSWNSTGMDQSGFTIAPIKVAIAVSIVDGLLILFGLVLNLPLIVMLTRHHHKLQVMDMLVLNLCATDLVGSVFHQPQVIMRLLARRPLDALRTNLLGMATQTCILADCAALFLVTLDKYLGIRYPLHYSRWFVKRKIAAVVIASWIVASCLGLLFGVLDRQVTGILNSVCIMVMFVTTTSMQIASYFIAKRHQMRTAHSKLGKIESREYPSSSVVTESRGGKVGNVSSRVEISSNLQRSGNIGRNSAKSSINAATEPKQSTTGLDDAVHYDNTYLERRCDRVFDNKVSQSDSQKAINSQYYPMFSGSGTIGNANVFTESFPRDDIRNSRNSESFNAPSAETKSDDLEETEKRLWNMKIETRNPIRQNTTLSHTKERMFPHQTSQNKTVTRGENPSIENADSSKLKDLSGTSPARRFTSRAARTITLLTSVFIMSWLPQIVLSIYFMLTLDRKTFFSLIYFLVAFQQVHVCVNPFIYVFRTKAIRERFVACTTRN